MSRDPLYRVNPTHAQLDAEWAKLTKEIKVHALQKARQWKAHLEIIRTPAWREAEKKRQKDEAQFRDDWNNSPG